MKSKLFKSLVLSSVGIALSLGTIFSFTSNTQEAKAAPDPYSYTFTSKKYNASGVTVALGSADWSLNADTTYFAYDKDKGQQVGSNGDSASLLTLSTSSFPNKKITQIVVKTCGNSSIDATISVKVNNLSFGSSQKITNITTPTDFTFSGSATGDVEISWSQSTDEKKSKGIHIKSIDITFGDFTLTSLTATKNDDGKQWYSGDEVKMSDLTATAHYSDRNDKDVTNDCSFTTSTILSEGDNTITVSYTEGTNTKTASLIFNASPAEKELTGISAVDKGTLGVWYVGETVSPSDLTFTATYSDLSNKEVSGTVESTALVEGNNVLNISYTENEITKNNTININAIIKPYPVSLAVVDSSEKTWRAGDSVTASDLTCTATYSDSTQKGVIGVVSSNTLIEGNNDIQVSYTDVGKTAYGTVKINALPALPVCTKVTSDPASGVWDGEYLFVYEGTSQSDSNLVWKGVDAANSSDIVTITNNQIKKEDSYVSFKIETYSTGYSIKVVGGDNTGKYINYNSTTNGISFGNSAVAYNISKETNGVSISFTKSTTTMSLRYNSASNQQRVRFYSSGQSPLQLYKVPGEASLNLSSNISKGYVGDSGTLTAAPVDCTPTSYEWGVSPANAVSFTNSTTSSGSNDFTFTNYSTSDTKVTITCDAYASGTKLASKTVDVTRKAPSLSLAVSPSTGKGGEQGTLTVTPTGFTPTSYSWAADPSEKVTNFNSDTNTNTNTYNLVNVGSDTNISFTCSTTMGGVLFTSNSVSVTDQPHTVSGLLSAYDFDLGDSLTIEGITGSGTISWSSSNTSIFTVPQDAQGSSVTLTSVGVGTANLIASINGGQVATSSITVNEVLDPYILCAENPITGYVADTAKYIDVTAYNLEPGDSITWSFDLLFEEDNIISVTQDSSKLTSAETRILINYLNPGQDVLMISAKDQHDNSADIEVDVSVSLKLTSIIAEQKTAKEYGEGSVIPASDIRIKECYQGGSTSEWITSGFTVDSTPVTLGQTTIKVTQTSSELVADCSITVVPFGLNSISIDAASSDLKNFVVGDQFSPKGITLTSKFNNSARNEILINNGTETPSGSLLGTLTFQLGNKGDSSSFVDIDHNKTLTKDDDGKYIRFKYTYVGDNNVTQTVYSTVTNNCQLGVSWNASQFTIKNQNSSPVVFQKISSASDISIGDTLIFVGTKESANYAMSAEQGGNNRQTKELKSTDFDTKGNILSTVSNDVQRITVEEGAKSGTVAFNVGSGYLYAASSDKNYLKTEDSLSNNSSWIISGSDGSFSATAQGDNSRKVLQYNKDGQSNLFSCYSSDSQTNFSIYKQVGGTVYNTPSEELVNACYAASKLLTEECAARSVTSDTWNQVASLFTEFLADPTSEDYKALMFGTSVKSNGNVVEDFLAKYDIITSQAKYSGLTKFITASSDTRKPNVSSGVSISKNVGVSSTISAAIAVSSIAILLAATGLFFYKRKKKEDK